MKSKIALIAALSVLAGCSSTALSRTDGGGLVAPSGEAGRAAILRNMNGGLIGGSVGQALSERERRTALEAEYKALEYTPSGQAVAWTGDAGHSGEVVAAQPYRVGSQDCRQYTHKVTIGGQTGQARGTACRNADGSWTPLT
jgi:surface antigen